MTRIVHPAPEDFTASRAQKAVHDARREASVEYVDHTNLAFMADAQRGRHPRRAFVAACIAIMVGLAAAWWLS